MVHGLGASHPVRRLRAAYPIHVLRAAYSIRRLRATYSIHGLRASHPIHLLRAVNRVHGMGAAHPIHGLRRPIHTLLQQAVAVLRSLLKRRRRAWDVLPLVAVVCTTRHAAGTEVRLLVELKVEHAR